MPSQRNSSQRHRPSRSGLREKTRDSERNHSSHNQRSQRRNTRKKSGKGPIIAIVVVLACAVLGGIIFAVSTTSSGNNAANSPEPVADSSSAPSAAPSLSLDQTKGTISTVLSIMDRQTPTVKETMKEFFVQMSRQAKLGLDAALKDASNHIKDHGFEARMKNSLQAVETAMNRVYALPESPARSAMQNLFEEWKAAIHAVEDPTGFDQDGLETLFNQFEPSYESAKEQLKALL